MASSLGSLSTVVSAGLFVVLLSSPVWLASRLVGADYPTLWRSFLSLVMGAGMAFLGSALAGGYQLLLVPLSFLVAFKVVLGTSVLGAVMMAILAFLGFAALGQVVDVTFHR